MIRVMGTKKKKSTSKSAGRKLLDSIEEEIIREKKAKKRKRYPKGAHTKIAKDVRAGKRKPPPVPKGKSAAEIKKMDADDPEFKHKSKAGKTVGRPRKRVGVKPKDLDWPDAIRATHQKELNKGRAKVRKHEAEVISTVTELDRLPKPRNRDVDDETVLIEEGYLSIDDWDDEELMRGYRRKRNGKFGSPPKYVPRELQQEIMRRLLRRGERKLAESYLKSVDKLILLAESAGSEKVQLEAIKELMNRLVGKVPERINIAADAPYQDMLADSLVPISELPPIDVPGRSITLPATDDDEEGTIATGGRDA